jgi:deoxyribodipyrimidine photo-lyase
MAGTGRYPRESPSDAADDGDAETASPPAFEVPTPSAVRDGDDTTGSVVWHRKHFRTEDHLALARAVETADTVCPLFVFDPAFYGTDGIACDARVRFLHEALAGLDRLYAATPAPAATRNPREYRARLAATTRLDPVEPDGRTVAGGLPTACARTPGVTFGYGDPVELLSRFVEQDWTVLTMATPTSRYGQHRDERVREVCGDAVEFVSGDGLVRDAEWSRANWQSRVETWLTDTQHSPEWTDRDVTRFAVETGVTPAVVDTAFDVAPEKTRVPTGTHRAAAEQLRSFVDRIPAYPRNISSPGDARDGTSGLSPYINFGLFSVRQVHQHVAEHAPECRGLEMFTDRLVWNMHYNQKLVDWSGWTERAVNPVFEGFNQDRHDSDLVAAWKRGETGFPMVDASMRCLRETGWLNFRMRAMCASFFAHVLQQPWWVGADWYHHHLIDSDVGINYTQWQSQAGLIGKPAQRVYNPRKQVRDHEPDGEWIAEWVPELAPLPSQHLDRPERTPLSVQEECGVAIGEDYPRPVVDFEARREEFWSRYERYRPAAARRLSQPEVAKRASFSGGYEAAKAIAAEHGSDREPDETGTQASLTDVGTDASPSAGTRAVDSTGRERGTSAADTATGDSSDVGRTEDTQSEGEQPTVPRGAGERAGEPSPDDRMAASARGDATERNEEPAGGSETEASRANPKTDQTTLEGFD